MKLQLDEVRRLTGPNLLWDKPGAIVDVFIDGVDPQRVVARWQHWVRLAMDDIGWPAEQSTYRLFDGGINLAISAPLDALYTACEIAELAWDACASEILQKSLPDWQARLAELQVERAQEANTAMLDLVSAAARHEVTCLLDDDHLSFGMGATVEVWPIDQLPSLEQVDWSGYADVPIALITGTNGKSTSVRLAAAIASRAGYSAGVTSTDFIRVGETIIDTGDYSGPGGARMLLRDTRTQIACLEVARGGILRRGLPIVKADAALVTNIASDHLGQYGVNTVEDLAEAKFVVSKALSKHSVLVVNADDALSCAQAPKADNVLCWFSLDEHNPTVLAHLAAGGRAVYVSNDNVLYQSNHQTTNICAVKDIAMAFNGTAKHNIQNALGVIGLSMALKLPLAAIQQGLHEFGSDSNDNPGRGNHYSLQGCSVVVDFAHNEHSMRAVVEMAQQMPAKKRIVMFSHAGDRSDKEIRELSDAIMQLDADIYIAAELQGYLRGRELGEIPALIRQHLAASGIDDGRIRSAADPLQGAQLALASAAPGDVVLLFVLDQRQQVHEWLTQQSD